MVRSSETLNCNYIASNIRFFNSTITSGQRNLSSLGDINLRSLIASGCHIMCGESPCPGNLIGEVWLPVTASTNRQAGKEGRVKRWADDLLFIDARRERQELQAGLLFGSLWKQIPRQNCKRNTICSWRSLGVRWLYEHVDVPQKQLVMRASNIAHFSTTNTAEF